MTWNQVYDPLNSQFLSTAVAAIPIVLLLVMIASNKVKTHWAAAIALVLTILVAVFVFNAVRSRLIQPEVRRVAVGLGVLTLFQAGLGVVTLMQAAPLSLSMLHQATAALLLSVSVALTWRARRV